MCAIMRVRWRIAISTVCSEIYEAEKGDKTETGNEEVWMNFVIHGETANGYWVRRLRLWFLVAATWKWVRLDNSRKYSFFSCRKVNYWFFLCVCSTSDESLFLTKRKRFQFPPPPPSLLRCFFRLWLNSTLWFHSQSTEMKWKSERMMAESDAAGKTMRSKTKNAVFIHKNYCILTCLIFISISMTATPAKGTRCSRHSSMCDSRQLMSGDFISLLFLS